MTWAATLDSVEKKGGMVYATVTFSSDQGDAPITQTNHGDSLDQAALKMWVTNRLASLNDCDAAYSSIVQVETKKPLDLSKLSAQTVKQGV